MQNTVISTEDEWVERKVKSVGWMVRGSKDFPEKQDPGFRRMEGGMGDNITVIDFLTIKGKKGQKPKPKRVWNFYHCHSGSLVLNSQLYPQTPTQETRRFKEKETPFLIPNQVTK